MYTPELKPFAFTDTGITVLIRKVSPMLANELRKTFPPPEPPLQEVEMDGQKITEPNPAHPEYQRALSQYNQDMEKRMRRLLIKRGVAFPDDVTEKEAIAQVAALREEWRQMYDQELDETDDKVAFVWFIAAGTDKGIEELTAAIMSRSQPTRDEVEAAKASFPG